MESEKETNRLNSDDTKSEQDEEQQQRGECCDHQNAESQINGKKILKAIQIVEKDSMAIAESFTSLFASLRSTLSEVTSTSIDHMNCFGDAAGRVQECALDAATKGNRYINSCLRPPFKEVGRTHQVSAPIMIRSYLRWYLWYFICAWLGKPHSSISKRESRTSMF
ncbi:uncharacterized protein [Nicotiana tomentosiformis]|uniref:uncharacterized protein isoform X1 n=1 Tax=Nicotiana tomentosiformis TaxID=4098 RepID=UPI00388CE133